jgi:AraC family transcriptional activator of tynA and feaB
MVRYRRLIEQIRSNMTERLNSRQGLPPEISHWSTEGVEPHRKTEFWIEAVCEAFFRLECTPQRRDAFEGSLSGVPVADFYLCHAIASPQQIRSKPPASLPEKQAFYLTTDIRSSWAITQDGVLSHLKCGELALIDARRPSLSQFPAGTNAVTLELPLTWVQNWLAAVDVNGARVISCERGWGKVLSTLCAELGSSLSLASQASPQFLADQLGELLAASLEPLPPGARQAPDLANRALAAMYERQNEPGLSVLSVAQQLGVSVRTLHRCFAAQNTTFATTLRRIRLERAIRLLDNPRLAQVSIADIARRSGFLTSSHFIREFQQQWGATPGRWRRDARTDKSSGEA